MLATTNVASIDPSVLATHRKAIWASVQTHTPQKSSYEPPVENIRRRLPISSIISTSLIALLLIGLAQALIFNDAVHWNVVGQYVLSPTILAGALTTLELTSVCMVLASLLGTMLAVIRLSNNRVAKAVVDLYVWVFRGTPVILQLIIFYNISAIFPGISFSWPFSQNAYSIDLNEVLTPMLVAHIGLTLYTAAYMAEIVRAGIQSVDPGQREAAKAIGLPAWQTYTKVLLPQALRAIVPPAGNQLLVLVKNSAIITVIGGADLMSNVRYTYNGNFEVIALLIVATVWYLVITFIYETLIRVAEQRLNVSNFRGSTSDIGPMKRAANRRLQVKREGIPFDQR